MGTVMPIANLPTSPQPPSDSNSIIVPKNVACFSSKLAEFLKIITEVLLDPSAKVVVYASWDKLLDFVVKVLVQKNINCLSTAGCSMDHADRVIRKFQQS